MCLFPILGCVQGFERPPQREKLWKFPFLLDFLQVFFFVNPFYNTTLALSGVKPSSDCDLSLFSDYSVHLKQLLGFLMEVWEDFHSFVVFYQILKRSRYWSKIQRTATPVRMSKCIFFMSFSFSTYNITQFWKKSSDFFTFLQIHSQGSLQCLACWWNALLIRQNHLHPSPCRWHTVTHETTRKLYSGRRKL